MVAKKSFDILDLLLYFQSSKTLYDIEKKTKHWNKKILNSTGKEMSPKKEWEFKWYMLTHKNDCESHGAG